MTRSTSIRSPIDYMQWMLDEFGDALPGHVRAQAGIAERPLTKFDRIIMGAAPMIRR